MLLCIVACTICTAVVKNKSIDGAAVVTFLVFVYESLSDFCLVSTELKALSLVIITIIMMMPSGFVLFCFLGRQAQLFKNP